MVETIRRNHEQLIDVVNLDTVKFAGWNANQSDKAAEIIQDFRTYLYEQQDEITALRILYNQPTQKRDITNQMIRDLFDKLKASKPTLAPFVVWKAYEVLEKVSGNKPKNELIALVSLICRILDIDPTLTAYDMAYDITINRNFQKWVFRQQAGALKFIEEQMEWLRMMKDFIAQSVYLERDDFELSPFAERGGLGKVWKLFGYRTFPLVDELNVNLAT